MVFLCVCFVYIFQWALHTWIVLNDFRIWWSLNSNKKWAKTKKCIADNDNGNGGSSNDDDDDENGDDNDSSTNKLSM